MSESIRNPDDVRYLLHLRLESDDGILAVDTWKDSRVPGGYRMATLWPHKLDANSIWATGILLLRGCIIDATPERSECLCTIYGDNKNYTGRLQLADATNVMAQLLSEEFLHPTYFEVCVNDFTFFADITALEGKELQAGLGHIGVSWRPQFDEYLAAAIASSSLLRMSNQMHVNLLRYVMQRARLDHETSQTL